MGKKFLKNKFKNLTADDIWYAENSFYLRSTPHRIIQLINLYEIFKKIIKLKGDIIECGVFKGASLIKLMTFSHFLDRKKPRKIYGFDTFGKFPQPKLPKDKMFLKKWEEEAGDGIDIKELNQYLKQKKFTNYKLIKGDIKKTIPKFLENNKNLKIALLHLDMDIYEGTDFAFKNLADKVVKNGIILIDDYKIVYGATKATKEYLKRNPNLRIKKVKFYKKPSFIIKS